MVAGVNDSLAGGQTAATIYANLITYCTARKAAGWKVAVCTEIDAQDTGRNTAGWHTTMYPALNTLIRNDYSFADAMIDLGGDARLQNALDTTYYNADKVHLIDVGYDVVASIAGPILAGM